MLKSRTHLDLINAIDHALAGRLFVPSLTSLSTVAGSRHTVQFHANDSHFLDEVSQLVGCDTSVGRAGRHRRQRGDPHWASLSACRRGRSTLQCWPSGDSTSRRIPHWPCHK